MNRTYGKAKDLPGIYLSIFTDKYLVLFTIVPCIIAKVFLVHTNYQCLLHPLRSRPQPPTGRRESGRRGRGGRWEGYDARTVYMIVWSSTISETVLLPHSAKSPSQMPPDRVSPWLVLPSEHPLLWRCFPVAAAATAAVAAAAAAAAGGGDCGGAAAGADAGGAVDLACWLWVFSLSNLCTLSRCFVGFRVFFFVGVCVTGAGRRKCKNRQERKKTRHTLRVAIHDKHAVKPQRNVFDVTSGDCMSSFFDPSTVRGGTGGLLCPKKAAGYLKRPAKKIKKNLKK